jgi:hypothetical protein
MVKQTTNASDLAGAEKNIFQEALNTITDFAYKLLDSTKPKPSAPAEEGSSDNAPATGGIPGANDIIKKIQELTKGAVKNLSSMSDQVVKQLKLDENEMVKSVQDQAKAFLKQMGLLDEEFENEDFY